MANKLVIIDCGTKTCKFGLSTDAEPTVIRTVVGKPKIKNPEATEEQFFIGDEAWNKRNELYLSFPIKRGIVIDWEAMEKIWRFMFMKMNVNPEICHVIYTAPLHPIGNREKIAKTMYENMKIPELLICTQVYLSSYVYGVEYGVIVSSGEGATHIVPIANNTVIQDAVVRFDLSGRDLTQHLSYLLRLNNGPLDDEHVNNFKENNCVVSQNDVDPLLIDMILKTLSNTCVICDNYTLVVKNEMFICPEALFKPTLAGREIGGIQESIYQCILKCPDVDDTERDKMRKNIILTGGNTMFPGFEDRLKKELKQYHKQMTDTKVIYSVKSNKNNQYLSWLGGISISKLSFVKDKFLKRENFEKDGEFSVSTFDS